MTQLLVAVQDELGGGWTRDYRSAPLTIADAVTAAQLFALGDGRAITRPGRWQQPFSRGGGRTITIDGLPAAAGAARSAA